MKFDTKQVYLSFLIILLCGFTINSNAGIISHWKLDEASGATAADETATNNGIITGGVTLAQPGVFGNAMQFDGSTGYVDLSPASISTMQDGAISAWINKSNGTIGVIVSAYDSTLGSTEGRYFMEGGRVRWDIRDQSAGLTEEAGTFPNATNPNDGQWHHVIIVLADNGGTEAAVIYFDGVLENSGFEPAWGDISSTLNGMSIGRNVDSGGGQWYWNGLLDDVAIFNEALTAGKAAAIYNLGVETAIAYNASECQQLFTAFDGAGNVTINTRLWTYVASGLTGTEGDLAVNLTTGDWELNLGGGAGFTTPGPTFGTVDNAPSIISPTPSSTVSAEFTDLIWYHDVDVDTVAYRVYLKEGSAPGPTDVVATILDTSVRKYAFGSLNIGSTYFCYVEAANPIDAKQSATVQFTAQDGAGGGGSLPSGGLLMHLDASAINIADTNQVRVAGPDLFVKQWNDQTGNTTPAYYYAAYRMLSA